MKGISPIIAVVLLIAFTIVVGSIFLLWSRGFVQSPLVETGEKAEKELECAYGFLELSKLKYCNGTLEGSILNRGTIKLKNITIQVIYPAPQVPLKFPLCLESNKIVSCEIANLSIDVNEVYKFNISISDPAFDEIRANSHCPAVYHIVPKDRIDIC
jgi:flagellin-like protein